VAYQSHQREVYLLQACLAVSLLSGLAFVAAAEWLVSIRPTARRIAGLGTLVVAGCTVLPALATSAADFNLRGDYSTWNNARKQLASEPRSAVIYTRGDDETFPLWYAQRAGNVRTDVQVIPEGWLDDKHQR
jgi:hypothetical protein